MGPLFMDLSLAFCSLSVSWTEKVPLPGFFTYQGYQAEYQSLYVLINRWWWVSFTPKLNPALVAKTNLLGAQSPHEICVALLLPPSELVTLTPDHHSAMRWRCCQGWARAHHSLFQAAAGPPAMQSHCDAWLQFMIGWIVRIIDCNAWL